jgi:hypothetical protein
MSGVSEVLFYDRSILERIQEESGSARETRITPPIVMHNEKGFVIFQYFLLLCIVGAWIWKENYFLPNIATSVRYARPSYWTGSVCLTPH